MLRWYEIAILAVSAVSAFSALVGMCITWAESRRNNSVVLRLMKVSCDHPERAGENRGQQFAEFSVVLRNRGRPLHDMTVSLVFNDPPLWPQVSLQLRDSEESEPNRIFEKGMIAEPCLKSYKLREALYLSLSRLKDPRKQRTRLCVYSQGYLAAEWRLWGRFDGLKLKWNSLAWRFNRLFDRQMAENERGAPVVKMYHILPTFAVPSIHLESLADFVRSQQERES